MRNGAELGASQQPGGTGIIARIMHLFATNSQEQFLEHGKKSALEKIEQGRSLKDI